MSNYIDTRDLYQRKCELEDLRDALKDAKEAQAAAIKARDDSDLDEESDEYAELLQEIEDADAAVDAAEQDFGTDEEAELAELEAIENDMDARAFRDGETMVPEHMFTEYAEQLAEDCGDYNSRDAKWPYTCIDWEKAANDLKQDYSTVTYQGTDYYVRS